MQIKSVRLVVCAIAAVLALAGCGGGGGGSSGGGAVAVSSPTPTPTPTATSTPAGTTWAQGVFQPSSMYENFCAAPRSGKDIENNTFPDKPGSLIQELFWLRSWTHETYLWNTEVTDQNPANFTDRLTYFGVLKTNAITPSGKPKDQFHFTMLTSDYLAQTQSAPSASYGAEIRVFAATPPRDVRVVYTSAAPATDIQGATPKLSRGAKILVADGVDVTNGGTTQAQIDTLNNAVFPTAAGQDHTFVVQYTDGSQRTITLTSTSLVESPVNRSSVLTTATGKVGYMLLNTFSPFSSEQAIVDTMASLKAQGISDLVLDLRYNGGGLLAVASQLSYLVAGSAATAGHTFERLQFNAAAGANDPVTGQVNSPTPFYNTGLGFTVDSTVQLQALNLPRVYILATGSTCSASEAVINGLRGVNVNVVLIGSTTCGKPYGFYPADNCGETYFSIQFQGVNDKGFGDYADGFAPANSGAAAPVKIPGCAIADDFGHELGDTNEAMLAAALSFRASGSCPAPTAASPSISLARVNGDGPAIATSGRSPAQEFLRNNRDMRMPKASTR